MAKQKDEVDLPLRSILRPQIFGWLVGWFVGWLFGWLVKLFSRHLTTQNRSERGISSGQRGTGIVFGSSSSVFRCQYHCTNIHRSFFHLQPHHMYLSSWQDRKCNILKIKGCKEKELKTREKINKPIDTSATPCLPYGIYPLSNKNPSAWNFLSPEPEVTCGTVAIIIRVVLLSPYLRILGVSLSSIHYNQSHRVYINRRQQYICLIWN